MTRTDRIVLLEIVGPFFGSVLLFTSLFLAAGELQKLAEFAQKGVPVTELLTMVAYTMPYVLAYTIPMAMLLATLLGFGRLSGDSEIVALFASGTSFPRIMVPVIGFALAIALPIIVVNQSMIPIANQRREEMARSVRQRGSTAAATSDAFTLVVSGAQPDQRYLVRSEGGVRFGKDGTAFLDRVGILVFEHGLAVKAVGAARAEWKLGTNTWTLVDEKQSPLWMSDSATLLVNTSKSVAFREVTLGKPKDLSTLAPKVTEVTSAELPTRARVLRENGDLAGAREAEIEQQGRISFPLAALVFAMVGAPLGVQRTRSGKGMGFGFSVLITFVYWTTVQIFQAVGKGGGLPPMAACEIPNVVGVAVGIGLIWRVAQKGAVN